jgi:hypothetical protein
VGRVVVGVEGGLPTKQVYQLKKLPQKNSNNKNLTIVFGSGQKLCGQSETICLKIPAVMLPCAELYNKKFQFW